MSDPDAVSRLDRQIGFLLEADRLKTVIRANPVADGSRRENTAEHSWHLALFALVLADQAGPGVQIDRVVRMMILHDIVEIDAGDNPIHGTVDETAKALAETRAADRLFGLLPADQAAEFRALWDEFEAAETADARFAKALDRFQPPLLNMAEGGGSWRDWDVTYPKIETRVAPAIRRGAPGLWDWLKPRVQAFFARATF